MPYIATLNVSETFFCLFSSRFDCPTSFFVIIIRPVKNYMLFGRKTQQNVTSPLTPPQMLYVCVHRNLPQRGGRERRDYYTMANQSRPSYTCN